METLVQDIRYALRGLIRSRTFTIAAALTLALGIGANTAIFSVINGVLLQPMPYPDADRLAMVWLDNTRIGVREDITSYPNFLDWREQASSFEIMAAYTRTAANLTGDFEAERVAGAAVTADFFRTLGVAPASGRAFTEEEATDPNARVVIISHGLWQRRFGGSDDALSGTVRLNGTAYEVVGIMPEAFEFPRDAELWRPLAPSEQLTQARGAFWLHVVGRLAPGASIEAAQREMTGIADRVVEAYPQQQGYGVFVQSLTDHHVGDVRPALLTLLGAVGFLLLIACANVANLLLARAASRVREVAVRSALGAPRGRLVRQFLTESVVVAVVGGLVGLPIAVWGVDLLKALAPADLPGVDRIAVDPVVLAYAIGVSVATGIVCGLIPALRTGRTPVVDTLREGARGLSGGRGDRRARSALIVAEVALALVLLVGSGLLIRSFVALRGVDAGFDAESVLTARIPLSGPEYDSAERTLAFWDRLLEEVEALPAVESAAAGTNVLLSRLPNSGGVSIEGQPPEPQEERIEVTFDVVTPGFFRAVGTPLVAGRDFTDADRADAPRVAIVNQAMADRYWPGEDPVGRRFAWGEPQNEDQWFTIIGIVANARRTSPDREARPSGYVSHRQFPGGMMLIVRAAGDPLALAAPIRTAVRAIDPDQPVTSLATLDGLLSERIAQQRLTTLLVGIFSALALLLAAVGVYGVISYTVTRGTREIGIRLALGAAAGDVFRLVLRRVGALVLGGLAIGLVAALLLTRSIRGLLYGVSALDPVTFVAVPVVLVATALMAGFIPARRAMRVDPVVALREE